MAINPYETPRGRLHRLADLSRRQFLLIVGLFGAGAAALFGGVQSLKFIFPNATNEEPLAFKVDQDPASIQVGQPLQITQKRVSVVRDEKGYYAVYLICTHLGCTPNYGSDVVSGTGAGSPRSQNGWACPCHGSRYYIDSTNFYGPAPRPMDWIDVSFAPDGKLLVDRGKLVVQRTAGDATPPEWRLDPSSKQSNGKTYGV